MSYRYEEVASALESAIADGIYPAGARLPSVRNLRDRYGVSMTTVMEAYARLEDKGLIQPRPKSGHFVRLPPMRGEQPATSRPPAKPGPVSVSRLTMQIAWAPARADAVSLASALPTPAGVAELARSTARMARLHAPRTIDYERPEGTPVLRAAIARLLVDSGCMVHEDEVIVTNGAQEAIVLALRATTSANDVVAVESPTFFGVLQAIEMLGLRALELPTDPREGVELDALANAVRGGRLRACILAPTYQNPLGFCMSDENKQRLVSILADGDVPLIEDDVFGALGIDAPGPRPAKAFDRTGNVIHCGSFSKTISPALRIGWAVPGRFAEQLLRLKFLANLSTTLVPQLAVADFLSGKRFRRITQNAARLYSRRLRIMRDAVLTHFPSGTKCTAPAGGMILWVQMPEAYGAMDLLGRAREDGITFFPGNIFSPSGAYGNFLRLSVGCIEADAVSAVVRRLGELAHSCGRAT